jgi:hypothetical protein
VEKYDYRPFSFVEKGAFPDRNNIMTRNVLLLEPAVRTPFVVEYPDKFQNSKEFVDHIWLYAISITLMHRNTDLEWASQVNTSEFFLCRST